MVKAKEGFEPSSVDLQSNTLPIMLFSRDITLGMLGKGGI